MNIHKTLFQKMTDPSFYPHTVDVVELRETHISKVFLAGDFVYKIKKNVDLGFLDFRELENRRTFCNEEVRLNRRLADDIYLGVVPITFDQSEFHLDGPGNVVEYAVKMRRLSDNNSMATRLQTGNLEDDLVNRLIRLLADFYTTETHKTPPENCGTWDRVFANCMENFQQTAPFAGKLFDADSFNIVKNSTLTFLRKRKALFDHRVMSGRIQEGHGDLRSDHIYFTENGIKIIDCIEFSEYFRWEDSASDIGFLSMDLESGGHCNMAMDIVSRYIAATGDVGIYGLVDFYICYRAMVRLKVYAIRATEQNVHGDELTSLKSNIETCMNLACRAAARFSRPVLWVVCGLPGSGKSTVARGFSQELAVPVLQSDMIRKEIFEKKDEDMSDLPFGKGIYSPEATATTYEKMLDMAEEELGRTGTVILDATFGSILTRTKVRNLADRTGAVIFFLECVANGDILKSRLEARETGPSLSDARISHLEDFQKRFEPITELEPSGHVILNTVLPVEENVKKALDHWYVETHKTLP